METTRLYNKYKKLYGKHFTKKLCEYAVSLMYDKAGKIKAITKEELEEKLKQHNIHLEYNELYDHVYVANMCKADFYGDAVPDDDYHLCLFVKKMIDDPDGYDG